MLPSGKLFFTIVFFSFSCLLFSRTIPLENAQLNYTTVYFEENFVENAATYELELYTDSLLTKPFIKKNAAIPAFWIEDLNWGTKYYWKVLAYSEDHKELRNPKIHSFSILKVIYLNYSEIRVDVKKNDENRNAGGLISIDYTKSIINRKGRQVWIIPPLKGVPLDKMYVRDLRITRENTITFLTVQVPYEIDFDGNILWQAPYPFILNSDTIIYHHDFKKTSRGTYMVMGDRMIYRCIVKEPTDEELKNSPDVRMIKGELYKRTLITYVLEFDKNGQLIWYWDANDYLKDVDLNAKKVEKATPNFASHANAFSESKDGTKLFVSFRDLSRIVKLDKKTKKIERSYGEEYPSGEATVFVDMKNQHDASPTDRNTFYTFNNNGFMDMKTVSSILEVQDEVNKGRSAVIWKFDLNFDTLTKGKSINGGNIVELPNKNLLFCAGALNRIFEITKSKEIVWDALLYSHGINAQDTWQPFSQYRCNWVKQLNWYYFMGHINGVPVKKGRNLTFDLGIFNSGNTEDRYDVEIWSPQGQRIYQLKTPLIRSGDNLHQVVKIKSKIPLRELKILVKSQTTHQQVEVTKN